MCKIMIMAGIPAHNTEKAWKWARAARPWMTANDKDAFGYAAVGRYGLFSEKWTNVGESFRVHSDSSRGPKLLNRLLGTKLKVKDSQYMATGEYSRDVSTMILHSRMATCGLGIANAHPFVRADHALIHNGMITNSSDLKNIISTCDSETILNEYIDNDVSKNPSAIQNTVSALQGWYAVAVIAPHKSGKGYYVDVFKERCSNLYAGYVPQLETVVFATTAHILRATAKALNWKVQHVTEVPAETLIRMDADTGELVLTRKFTAPTERYDSWWEREYKKSTGATTDVAPVYGSAYVDYQGVRMTIDEYRALEADGLIHPNEDVDIIDDGVSDATSEHVYEDDDLGEPIIMSELKAEVAAMNGDDDDNVVPVDAFMRRKGKGGATHGELVAAALERAKKK